MKHFILLTAALLIGFNIKAQCEECIPDFTCTVDVPFPTICPLILPDATAGEEYETVMTFYLPATIVDPDTDIEAELQEVTITSVSGVPFGMAFTLNDENSTYFPSDGEEHGCATVCGIPLIAGEYEINIQVAVIVVAFGLEQTANESFSLPLTVLPGNAGNALFTIDQIASCGELTVTPESLIDGGNGITTHNWDFGNGTASMEAFPGPQTYTTPGDYSISLQTTIQNYVLTAADIITLGSGWGGDLDDGFGFLNPDPYFIIYDNSGTAIYTSPAVTDNETPEWNNLDVQLSNGPLTIDFYDSDGTLTDDDYLGTGEMNLASGTINVTAGGTTCSFEVELQTTFDLTESETVSVFAIPIASIEANVNETILSNSSPEIEAYSWFLNGELLDGEINDSLQVSAAGMYQVELVSIFGCTAISEAYLICPSVALSYNSNTGAIEAPEGFDTYTWSFNGLENTTITGASFNDAPEGNFQVTVTNSDGCEVSSEVFTYSGINEAFSELSIACFPNPASTFTRLTLPATDDWTIQVFDASGRLLVNEQFSGDQLEIALNQFKAGVYTIKASNKKQRIAYCRFIKK